jgi:hypothetical protein
MCICRYRSVYIDPSFGYVPEKLTLLSLLLILLILLLILLLGDLPVNLVRAQRYYNIALQSVASPSDTAGLHSRLMLMVRGLQTAIDWHDQLETLRLNGVLRKVVKYFWR